ncbi:dihydrofolate reductase [Micropruina sp.]|uniref:dihydrofolate reductase n=1 Tax=Micropruina sp. TaxID=2737536 RepID=UPI0039E668C7
MSVVAIAAVGRNGAIGRQGDVPWHIPADWQRFKRVTTGCSLIMGRATFEAIGRPLPGRGSIVVSRDPDAGRKWLESGPGGKPLAEHTTVLFVDSIAAALAAADHTRTVWIGGGAQIYRAAWPLTEELDICEVDQSPEADAFFPAIEPAVWHEVERDQRDGYAFVRYHRRVADQG